MKISNITITSADRKSIAKRRFCGRLMFVVGRKTRVPIAIKNLGRKSG